jgi:hypothetical protein
VEDAVPRLEKLAGGHQAAVLDKDALDSLAPGAEDHGLSRPDISGQLGQSGGFFFFDGHGRHHQILKSCYKKILEAGEWTSYKIPPKNITLLYHF